MSLNVIKSDDDSSFIRQPSSSSSNNNSSSSSGGRKSNSLLGSNLAGKKAFTIIDSPTKQSSPVSAGSSTRPLSTPTDSSFSISGSSTAASSSFTFPNNAHASSSSLKSSMSIGSPQPLHSSSSLTGGSSPSKKLSLQDILESKKQQAMAKAQLQQRQMEPQLGSSQLQSVASTALPNAALHSSSKKQLTMSSFGFTPYQGKLDSLTTNPSSTSSSSGSSLSFAEAKAQLANISIISSMPETSDQKPGPVPQKRLAPSEEPDANESLNLSQDFESKNVIGEKLQKPTDKLDKHEKDSTVAADDSISRDKRKSPIKEAHEQSQQLMEIDSTDNTSFPPVDVKKTSMPTTSSLSVVSMQNKFASSSSASTSDIVATQALSLAASDSSMMQVDGDDKKAATAASAIKRIKSATVLNAIPETDEQLKLVKKLREKAMKSKLFSSKPSLLTLKTAVKPPSALLSCHGGDILRRGSSRKDRYLISFPGCIKPTSSATVTLGWLSNLNTPTPVLYLEFPQGRLKFQGVILHMTNRFVTFQCRGSEMICEDAFDKVIAFPEYSWIGTAEENPKEQSLPIPAELENILAASLGSQEASMDTEAQTKTPTRERSRRRKFEEDEEDVVDDADIVDDDEEEEEEEEEEEAEEEEEEEEEEAEQYEIPRRRKEEEDDESENDANAEGENKQRRPSKTSNRQSKEKDSRSKRPSKAIISEIVSDEDDDQNDDVVFKSRRKVAAKKKKMAFSESEEENDSEEDDEYSGSD